jgi:hypothetical protein
MEQSSNKDISIDIESDLSDISIESQNILDKSNYIGPFADKMIKDFIYEIRKDKNMDKIRKNVLDPVLCDINDRYFPHMVTLITLLILIVLLLTLILVLYIFDKKETETKIK